MSLDGTRLYVSRSDGKLDIFDLATHSKVDTLAVGKSLGAISISEDGSYLLIVERQPAAGKSTIYRVETDTGAKQAFSKNGSAFYDVELVDGDTAILTGDGENITTFQPTTGTFGSITGGAFYSDIQTVIVEDDRYSLLAEPLIGNGPLFLFDDQQNKIVADGDTYDGGGDGFNFGEQAISEEAGIVIQFNYYTRLRVYDLDLNFLKYVDVGGTVVGLAFDETGQHAFIYFADGGVVKYDVSTWTAVESFDVAASGWHNEIGYGNQLLLDDAGRYISVLDYNADTVRLIDLSARNETINGTPVEDELYGGDGDDVLNGKGGNDVLDGGAGADRMSGGAGDDRFIVDQSDDVVTELSGAGNDSVEASASFRLSANVEELKLTGSAVSAIGNALGNLLAGNSAANIIDGAAGSDTMIGGVGDDVYYVDRPSDTIVESSGEGDDTARSSASYALAAEVENLVLLGRAVEGSGNELANRISGNSASNLLKGLAGDDLLDGGTGADTMEGGAGSDTYFVDNSSDKVVETSATGGTDKVNSSVSFALGANVEELVLTGGWSVNGTGNILANVISGNSGANRLDGKGGADTMIGGKGDDTFVVDNSGDQVIEEAQAGTDTVETSLSFTLAPNLENLLLTGSFNRNGHGNAANNLITGNDGGNRLGGGGGSDVINGGAGNDTINGDLGKDRLTGGEGLDNFVFGALGPANADSIADFSVAEDSIKLSRAAFGKAGPAGTLSAGAFHQGTAAADADDRIVYDQATGRIFYDPDGIGTAGQVLFATVTAGTALTHADFVVFG